VALFYGEQDNILDIPYLSMELPGAYVHKQRHYEHLDFLWARDVHRSVYPLVLHVLQQHNTPPVAKPRSATLTELVSDNYPVSAKGTAADSGAKEKKASSSYSGNAAEVNPVSPEKEIARFYAQRSMSLPIPPRSPLSATPLQEAGVYGNAAIPGVEPPRLHKVESSLFEEESDLGL